MVACSQEITPREYTKCILHIADTDGLEIANRVNHMALESGHVPLNYFQAAAAELANRIINNREE